MMNVKTRAGELEKLKKDYWKAKGRNDLVTTIEKQCKEKVLSENQFFVSPEFREGKPNKRITDTTEDFLMTNADFERYCKLVHGECIKKGLEIPDYNTTADHATRGVLKQAEETLLDFAIEITPITERETLQKARGHWKHRDEMLNLILKLDLSL